MNDTDGFHSQTLDFFKSTDLAAPDTLGTELGTVIAEARLRPLETVRQRLGHVLGSPSATQADVAQAVSADFYLTLRLLASVPGHLSRVEDALREVPRKALRQAVLDPPVNGSFSPSDRLATGLWHECAAIAVMSRLIALELEDCDPAEARTCGLCHGLGAFVLYPAFPTRFDRIFRDTLLAGPPRAALERASFGADHAELGAAVAQRLDLSPRITAVLRHHHDPQALGAGGSSAGLRTLAEVLAIAERIVQRHMRPDGSFLTAMSSDPVDTGSLPIHGDELRHLWPDFLRENGENSIMLLPIAS